MLTIPLEQQNNAADNCQTLAPEQKFPGSPWPKCNVVLLLSVDCALQPLQFCGWRCHRKQQGGYFSVTDDLMQSTTLYHVESIIAALSCSCGIEMKAMEEFKANQIKTVHYSVHIQLCLILLHSKISTHTLTNCLRSCLSAIELYLYSAQWSSGNIMVCQFFFFFQMCCQNEQHLTRPKKKMKTSGNCEENAKGLQVSYSPDLHIFPLNIINHIESIH